MRSKYLLPILALAVSFAIISCGNGKDRKKEAPGIQQPEVGGDVKKDAGIANTVILPGDEIPLNKLPVDINMFIETNYAGYTMANAASDPLCGGADAIDVAVTKFGAPNLSLIFKPDGSFVQQEEDLPLTTATDKIKMALKAKYAGYSAGAQIEKLTLADKSVQYLVDLSKGNATKEVIFTADGVIVCEG